MRANYKVEFASGSLTNSFESLDDGLIWGTGIRWNATQGTIVSAAMALDLSFTQTIVFFCKQKRRFFSPCILVPKKKKGIWNFFCLSNVS